MHQVSMLDLRREYEYMREDIDSALKKCLEHQKWIFGPEVKELEDRIGSYLGVKHCVGISSGTDALVLSLRALAIKLKGRDYFEKDELIITTPFTFTATGDAILRAGATPVFVDIDPHSYNIDASKVKEFLETGDSRVVGILPVHLYGQTCDMSRLMALASQYGLFVLEDVAQAFGATWNGNRLGSLGSAGAFSFFPSKNLGGFGDAGMVATNHEEIAELVRILLRHGGKDKYNVDHIGYNARLDTLQGAILLAKLRYIDEFNGLRRKIAETYTKNLEGIAGLSLPSTLNPAFPLSHFSMTNSLHVFHQYTVRVTARDKFQDYLKTRGIATMIYYPFPLHKMKVFKGRMLTAGQLANAERAAGEVLSLPMEPLQKDEETAYVIDSVKQFFLEPAC